MPRTTLKDVGARVGVSAKTVSNVVNGTGWVTDEVADRVRAAMAELGYRPNLAARQLRSGRSGMIALALPQLAQPYFAELASQLVRAAHERGITVLIQQTDSDVEAERRILSGIGAPAVDGLIMSPLTLGPADLYARTDPTPLLLLGEQAGPVRTRTWRWTTPRPGRRRPSTCWGWADAGSPRWAPWSPSHAAPPTCV